MRLKTIDKRNEFVPESYIHSFETSELDGVEKRFGYHPERLMAQFFDAVAGNLNGGRTLSFPLGTDMPQFPTGIRFVFEGQIYMILLPEPMADDPTPLISTVEVLAPEEIYRAAAYFTYDFVMEYKRFFKSGIRHSKKLNGVI